MIENFAPKKETDGSLIKNLELFCSNLYSNISVTAASNVITTDSFVYDGQTFKSGGKLVKIGEVSYNSDAAYSAKIIVGKLANGENTLTPEPIIFLYGTKQDFVKEITETEKYKGYSGLIVGLQSPVTEKRIGNQSQIQTSLFFGYKYDSSQNLTPKKKSIELFDEIILPNIDLFRMKLETGKIYEQIDSLPDLIKHDAIEVTLSDSNKTTLLFTFCELKNIKLGFKI